MKTCTNCKQTKPEYAFSWRSAKHKKRFAQCKECRWAYDRCRRKKNPEKQRAIDKRSKENRKKRDLKGYQRSQRNSKLKAQYGITVEQYEEMLEVQSGVCAICGSSPNIEICGKIADLHVDHDHETGRVRALLCSQCNTALGLLDHDSLRIGKLLMYLMEHGIK